MNTFIARLVLMLPLVAAFRRQRQTFSRSGFRFNMMAELVWSPVRITKNEREAEGLRLIEVEVTSEIASAYKTAGQYVQIRSSPESKPGFYAIASPPESPIFTFLVKDSENNAPFTSVKEGFSVEMSNPMGKGYQTQEYFEKYKFDYPTMQVVMLATGTGIAPIAAAIDSNKLGMLEKGYTSLYERKGILYIGARTEAHLPFKNKYEEWEKKGVRVVPVLSKPDGSWKGYTGYVQDALRKDTCTIPRNTGALVCGQRGMTDAVREILLEAGVFEGRILLNY